MRRYLQNVSIHVDTVFRPMEIFFFLILLAVLQNQTIFPIPHASSLACECSASRRVVINRVHRSIYCANYKSVRAVTAPIPTALFPLLSGTSNCVILY